MSPSVRWLHFPTDVNDICAENNDEERKYLSSIHLGLIWLKCLQRSSIYNEYELTFHNDADKKY